jgi:hypothetical protein
MMDSSKKTTRHRWLSFFIIYEPKGLVTIHTEGFLQIKVDLLSGRSKLNELPVIDNLL